MGQAKRRSKNKSEFSWPRISFDKEALLRLKAKARESLAQGKGHWQALPKLHRRALSILVPVVAVLLIMPTSLPVPDGANETVRRDLVLDLSEDKPDLRNAYEKRPEPLSPARRQVESVSNEPVVDEPVAKPVARQASDKWMSYKVKQGDTLAQVFRENALPESDLYAVVNIEGADKPLSHVKAGQLVRYKLSSDGALAGLQVEGRDGEPVLFLRNQNGKFVRHYD